MSRNDYKEQENVAGESAVSATIIVYYLGHRRCVLLDIIG